MKNLFQCPCCGNNSLSERGNYEICSICLWEDDPVQHENPNYRGGANQHSLNKTRAIWHQNKTTSL